MDLEKSIPHTQNIYKISLFSIVRGVKFKAMGYKIKYSFVI
jgi:hypothetical protein